jgi:glycosyltransferase involved in cell wall biosynthesis
MRVIHVVAGLSPAAAGLAEVVPRLAREIARLGHEATIATVAAADDRLSDAANEAEAAGVRIVRFAPSFPRAAYASWEMAVGMKRLARFIESADLAHVHSNWTFPVWWGCQAARNAGKPVVMSPHGCLDPVRLQHSAWKKRLIGSLDRRCLRRAAVIHATSQVERGWIRKFLADPPGGPRIEVIPNGVDLPGGSDDAGSARQPAASKTADRVRRVVYLGRLHPLKGLDLLVEAWGRVAGGQHAAARWELVIAGPDEQGTRGRLEALAKSLSLSVAIGPSGVPVTGRLVFAGPLYGDDKARLLRQADLVVMPSRSENFGIVVAEALAAKVPVVTTTATPWAEIDGLCGWCVEPAVEPLAVALSTATRLTDAERAALGARGRRLIEEQYTWATVRRQMEQLYAAIVG